MADAPCPCRCTPLPACAGNRPWVRVDVDLAPARAGRGSAVGRRFLRARDHVADDAAQIGLEPAQASVGALELMGMGIALMLDQRQLPDPRIALTQLDTDMRGKPYQAFSRSV